MAFWFLIGGRYLNQGWESWGTQYFVKGIAFEIYAGFLPLVLLVCYVLLWSSTPVLLVLCECWLFFWAFFFQITDIIGRMVGLLIWLKFLFMLLWILINSSVCQHPLFSCLPAFQDDKLVSGWIKALNFKRAWRFWWLFVQLCIRMGTEWEAGFSSMTRFIYLSLYVLLSSGIKLRAVMLG